MYFVNCARTSHKSEESKSFSSPKSHNFQLKLRLTPKDSSNFYTSYFGGRIYVYGYM